MGGTGSSPHTRGAPLETGERVRPRGIIPAYAGSTSIRAPPIASHRDHPRIRGEHQFDLARDAELVGSSPHTRGAQYFPQGGCQAIRIIPAYAGSTIRARWRTGRRWDHPRIRGEHPGDEVTVRELAGSSPHTRGAPGWFHLHARSRRIIPAYAGSTSGPPPAGSARQDHPRIRGEHTPLT